jgi:peptidoglycan-associated lipoprotein
MLMRFAAAALSTGAAGCDPSNSPPQVAPGLENPAAIGPQVVYGPPPVDPQARPEFFQDKIERQIHFDSGSHRLSNAAKAILDRQIAWLKANRRFRIVVEGHADQRGTREYNLGLAQLRAEAAKTYMVVQGIAFERIEAISYGEERLAVDQNDQAAWAKNRRVVTRIDVR